MTCAESISGVGVFHFWMTVISRGQHETAPLEGSFLSLDGAGELLPEWWQFSMSAICSDGLWLTEFLWLAEASTIAWELARTGCVQPMTQAKTAIHSEITVAIPALIMRNEGRISPPVYAVGLPGALEKEVD